MHHDKIPYLHNRIVTPSENLGKTIAMIYREFYPKTTKIYSEYDGAIIIEIVIRDLITLESITEIEQKTGLKCHNIGYYEDKSTPSRSGVAIFFNYRKAYREEWEKQHPEIIDEKKVYK